MKLFVLAAISIYSLIACGNKETAQMTSSKVTSIHAPLSADYRDPLRPALGDIAAAWSLAPTSSLPYEITVRDQGNSVDDLTTRFLQTERQSSSVATSVEERNRSDISSRKAEIRAGDVVGPRPGDLTRMRPGDRR